jgi:drug/metabolite transporter (DMT)-like permease
LPDWVLLGALVAMWGSAFLLTKVALATLSPIIVVSGRLLVAALLLAALVRFTRRQLPRTKRLWLFMVAMAILGNCLPFYLISWGQTQIASGLAGILMAVIPLTTLVLAHFFVAGERMNLRRTGGFVLGFLGIVVLMGPEALIGLEGSGSVLIAELAVLGGALCYAANNIVARRQPESDAVVAAAGMIVFASMIMVPIAILVPTPRLPASIVGSLLAVAALGAFSTAAAAVVYFRLVASAGPTFLSLINYLIPLWAVAVGMVFLGERPHWRALLALALILAGIAMAQLGAPRNQLSWSARLLR